MARPVVCLTLLLLAAGDKLHATSCSDLPTCARVFEDSVLFVGTVLDVKQDSEELWEARVQVQEAFAGIRPGTTIAVVVSAEAPFERGLSYLFDVGASNGNQFEIQVCGLTGAVEEDSTKEVLQYLWCRLDPETPTSVTVSVSAQYEWLDQAEVTLIGSDGTALKGRTGREGKAEFQGIRPGRYRAAASRAHFRPPPDSPFDEQVNALPGTCHAAHVSLQSDAAVSGLVRNASGEPEPFLGVDLVEAAQDPSTTSPRTLSTETNEAGEFRFDAVLPGYYLLGANIRDGGGGQVPPTYFPGHRDRAAANPIEVGPGETVDQLGFTLPDFGGKRRIKVCVINEKGEPATGAELRWPFDTNHASLRSKLETGTDGCAQTYGYTRVSYAVEASLRPTGMSIFDFELSGPVVIPAGEQPAVVVLRATKMRIRPHHH